uniref:Sm domain-containing protein n=2 Tax=Anopheles stephensi TaxID=30069 RepID=A0A182Y8X0_ANOST
MDLQQKDCYDEDSDEEDKAMQKRKMLRSWLNRLFRIKMTDGRILNGYFVCTDADANVVLQGTSEFTEIGGEERILGLVMIPGRYIVSIEERNPPVFW